MSFLLSISESDSLVIVGFLGSGWFPRSLLEGQNVVVELGSSATLYCIGNHPNGTYTWRKDKSDVDLESDKRYSVGPSGILQIHQVVEGDSGQYDCIYTFPGKEKKTRRTQADLKVYGT